MFGINGAELVVLLLIAAVVIGPERLPTYADQLARWVRGLRSTVASTKDRLAAELGEDAVDWASLDPRRYDPRRIVRRGSCRRGSRDAQSTASSPSSAARRSLVDATVLRSPRTHRASWSAYVGSRSGPITTAAISSRTTSSAPLIPNIGPGYCASVAGGLIEHHPDVALLAAVGPDREGHRVPGRGRPDRDDQLVRRRHRPTVDGDDDVAGLDARSFRRTTWADRWLTALGLRRDLHALADVAHVQQGPDHGVGGDTGLDELLGGASGLVGRDREADPDAAGALCTRGLGDRRVDPDHLAVGVHQGSPGVAGIDRRVGLDRVDEGGLGGVARSHRPVEGTDDAYRDGPLQAERGTDRDHRLSHD